MDFEVRNAIFGPRFIPDFLAQAVYIACIDTQHMGNTAMPLSYTELKDKIGENPIDGVITRKLLREWLKGTVGLIPERVDKMSWPVLVKCYTKTHYLKAVTRAHIRDQRKSQNDGQRTVQVAPGSGDIAALARNFLDFKKTIVDMVDAQNKQIHGLLGLTKADVEAMIKARLAPETVHVKVNDAKPIALKGRRHPAFDRVLKLIKNGANVLLVGPAGCGKTHLAEQIANVLKLDYGAIHGTAGASESALTGWLLPGKGGAFEYTPAPFVELFEGGESLFLFDEMDAFDPNMLLIVNGALANGALHIPHRRSNPVIKRGKGVHIVATANTYGTGNNPLYAGRSQLDAATLDRFVVITMDYDKDLEREIGKQQGLAEQEMSDIWLLRDRVRAQSLRRVISTRAFQKAGTMKAAGDDWKLVMATLVEGWSRDERTKVGY